MARALLVVTTLIASWLGMQAVHELGHVIGASLTGGKVARVVLHPLSLSRTDLSANPSPLAVAWTGPALGVLLPLALWGGAASLKAPLLYLPRFFAGFCLVANGAYIGSGLLSAVGDSETMLRHGAATWRLALFASTSTPLGFWLWHGQGADFGLGGEGRAVNTTATAITTLVGAVLAVLGFTIWGDG